MVTGSQIAIGICFIIIIGIIVLARKESKNLGGKKVKDMDAKEMERFFKS